jgi:hypothetical protein
MTKSETDKPFAVIEIYANGRIVLKDETGSFVGESIGQQLVAHYIAQAMYGESPAGRQ